MWRLCMDDHGKLRLEVLGMPESIFGDDGDGDDALPHAATVLYLLSPALFAVPADWPPSVRVVGSAAADATLPDASSTIVPPLSLPEKPFVWVCFGSMPAIGACHFSWRCVGQVLEAVHRTTALRFVYHVPVASLDADGSPDDAATTLSVFEGVSRLSGVVDLSRLLGHPSCVAAVTHGGGGTVAAVCRAGIPQIVCPFMFDQQVWCKRLVDLNVAVDGSVFLSLLEGTSVVEAAACLSGLLGQLLGRSHDGSVCVVPPERRAAIESVGMQVRLEDGASEAAKVIVGLCGGGGRASEWVARAQ
mmetsp:Transcript_6388/g.18395  ORF Transcript_6388/g.18395 Transcript_6388/m.18395 type:complete len:303 (+) Transcript_6388:682-1590(+)